jgi:hypothetical protein
MWYKVSIFVHFEKNKRGRKRENFICLIDFSPFSIQQSKLIPAWKAAGRMGFDIDNLGGNDVPFSLLQSLFVVQQKKNWRHSWPMPATIKRKNEISFNSSSRTIGENVNTRTWKYTLNILSACQNESESHAAPEAPVPSLVSPPLCVYKSIQTEENYYLISFAHHH